MKKTEKITNEFVLPVQIEVRASISCLICGRQHSVDMPKYATQNLFVCPDCGYQIKSSSDSCCVYCEYGTTPCPPQQRRALYFNRKT